MSLKDSTFHVLTILSDNLKENPPQLVPSTRIAGAMNIELPELEQVLKAMNGMGVIETDPGLQYNLITQKGLVWLGEQNPLV